MSSVPTQEEIWEDARWLVQALDPNAGAVRLIAMSSEAYRAASFLDDRMLQLPVQAQIIPWKDIAQSMPAQARQDGRWIFHIGHVGSTLVARLLGEIHGVLSIREPRILRDVALLPPETRGAFIEPLRKLMSRTGTPDEIALIKATSFVSEIAAELVPRGGRALFMFAQPRAYIESILAGENSRKELNALSPFRAERMHARVPSLRMSGMKDAHLAAAAWACEMTSLETAADRIGASLVAWGDFDRMLQNMMHALERITNFFELPVSLERLSEIVSGSLMGRYSKALEYEYSPALRNELLEEAGFHHRREIDEALNLLKKAAETSPLLQRALSRTAPEI